jgi:3-oxoacyl-[acyl-carrier protein] reductase
VEVIRMDMGLQGKAALVTGGAGGIGKAIATALAASGRRVVVADLDGAADRSSSHGRCARDRLRHGPQRHQVAVSEAATAFGRLDVVVNNAGGPPTGIQLDERAGNTPSSEPPLRGPYCEGAAVPQRSGSGRVINGTSVAVKQPIDGLMLSSATRLESSGGRRRSPGNSADITVNASARQHRHRQCR